MQIGRYDVKVLGPERDTYPNDFKCWVRIRDRKSGLVFKRRGRGKYIGNFAPIWVSINGKSMQLSELGRVTYDPTEKCEIKVVATGVARTSGTLEAHLNRIECGDMSRQPSYATLTIPLRDSELELLKERRLEVFFSERA